MKIITVIQARRGSTRLPNKVLKVVLNNPILLKMVHRVQQSTLKGEIVIATTTDEKDIAIVDLCNQNKINCFRGHPTDLLDRHYQLAIKYNADVIVKIPSDCPLIDPKIIDEVLQYFITHCTKYDYVSNLHPATWPDGNDVEVMHISTLEKAWKEATQGFEREHTTPYIWENPQKFKIGSVIWNTGQDLSTTLRFTLDYPEDFAFIKRVYEKLYPVNPQFGLNDILQLLQQNPNIANINKIYAGEYWYKNHLNELKNIDDKWSKK